MNAIIASSNLMTALFLPVLLAACGMDTVYAPSRGVDDLYSFLNYAAPANDAQADIYGNPFAVPPEELAAAVLEGFGEGVRYGPRLTFSTHSESARPGYRFIVAFGPPPALTGDMLCGSKQEVLGLTPQARPLRVKAAFCAGNRAYSEASGEALDISGPADPHFRRWTRNLMFALTPPPDQKPMNLD